MRFVPALAAIALVIVIHIPLVSMGAYSRWPNIDIPMHFFGGFSMAMLALALHRASGVARKPWWERFLFVIGFVALIAILWEFHEFLIDATLVQNGTWERTQLSLTDTIADLLIGLLGGCAAYITFLETKKR